MIRRVVCMDRDVLRACHSIVNMFMDAGTGSEWFALKFLVDSGKSIMFVDEKSNGFVRGFLIGEAGTADCVSISNLFVDKNYHRMGVGRALLQAYEEYARASGVKKIKLQSRPTRQALGFYAQHGFQKINYDNYMQKKL